MDINWYALHWLNAIFNFRLLKKKNKNKKWPVWEVSGYRCSHEDAKQVDCGGEGDEEGPVAHHVVLKLKQKIDFKTIVCINPVGSSPFGDFIERCQLVLYVARGFNPTIFLVFYA